MLSSGLGRREPCTSCGQPVFLAQRLLVDRRLYHRTCFRCARCGAQLTLAACYETEVDGQYCCEMCPDEEVDSLVKESDSNREEKIENDLFPVLSDEEKSANLAKLHQSSEIADRLLTDTSKTIAFTGFMSSQLKSVDSDDDDVLPELPKTLPPTKSSESIPNELLYLGKPSSGIVDLVSGAKDSETYIKDNKNDSDSVNVVDATTTSVSTDDQLDIKKEDVHNQEDISQHETASVLKIESDRSSLQSLDKITQDEVTESNTSLVKMRMKIFEEANARTSTNAVSRKSYENSEKVLEIDSSKDNDISRDNSAKEETNVNLDSLSSVPNDTIVDTNSQNESHDFNKDVPYNENVPFVKQLSESSDDKAVVNVENETAIDIEDDEIKLKNEISLETEEKIIESQSDIKLNIQPEADVVASETPHIDVVLEEKSNHEVKEDLSNINLNIQPEGDLNVVTSDHPHIDIVVEEVGSSDDVEENSPVKLASQDPEPMKKEEYPEHLNPFSDDDESDTEPVASKTKRDSLNPFDEDEDEEEEPVDKLNSTLGRKSIEKPPRPPLPAILANVNKSQTLGSELKKITAPSAGFNPFSSDDDSDEEKQSSIKPVAAPRQKIGEEPASMLSVQSFYGSSSSLSSTVSRRKKAPAPKPPVFAPKLDNDMSITSQLSSPSSSLSHISPQVSPRVKKRRPAPRPPVSSTQPLAASTFIDSSLTSLNISSQNLSNSDDFISMSEQDDRSIISYSKKIISAADFDNDPDISLVSKEEKEKVAFSEETPRLFSDKSSTGQWKRRKGPAPAIPLLQKRNPGPPIPAAVIRRELQMLEEQQRGLERQGVRLEEMIREKCENGETPITEPDPETDELVLQLFELVNEKNELFRRQAELMYIRRQQRLEEEHADLEHQIRTLMSRPEANKTDSDKAREEQLIQRLIEVVERRDEVIASLEMDRVREKEEDKSIRERMASHRAKRDENSSISSVEVKDGTLKKEKKKEKKRWLKKDKDKVKSPEASQDGAEIVSIKKDKKHKKWF